MLATSAKLVDIFLHASVNTSPMVGPLTSLKHLKNFVLIFFYVIIVNYACFSELLILTDEDLSHIKKCLTN